MCSQPDDPSQHESLDPALFYPPTRDIALREIARTWVDYWTSREGALNDPILDRTATELMVRQFRAALNARGESAHAHRWQPGMVLLVCSCGEMEWRSQPSVAAVERRER